MKIQFVILCSLILAPLIHADVRPNSLFADNAVLQRAREIPVWGTAHEVEAVTVEFAGQKISTVAKNGRWVIRLRPMKADDTPQTMTITGDNTVTLTNILVGDVWVASGQSNMERQLGPRDQQPLIENWETQAASANYPQIREYYVPEHFAFAPAMDANGKWTVCSPETVKDFSAVGYFFARDIFQTQKIPIGILFTAVGGTPAESWTSAKSLGTMAEYKSDVKLIQQTGSGSISKQAFYKEELSRWYAKHDLGSKKIAGWQEPELAMSNWNKTYLPNVFFKDFPGIIWFRKQVELSQAWAGNAATLQLGKIDDADTAWVNGVRVGATEGWNADRHYPIPSGLLRPGPNTIAIRVFNKDGPGGFQGDPALSSLNISSEKPIATIPMAGEWYYRVGNTFEKMPELPRQPDDDYIGVTVLFNAMIAPLQSFPIKGVIWYQGESNNDRANQYQELFPLLISDWRQGWNCGRFPFLFVQIAPHRDMRPELREAQFLTLKKSPNTAMAVITDAGDADDIHPARKQVPGERLAQAARALAYGEKLEYSGPLFDSMKIEGNKAVILFTHIGDGLVAKNGELKGFTVASADKNFVPAKAKIQDKTVIVWSDQVLKPAAVRYGWANVPDINLFNNNGLPASPFRTDNDEP
jgi:sialate O-acetylesterase